MGTKFQVGDKVRCVNDQNHDGLYYGSIHTISSCESDTDLPALVTLAGMSNTFFASRFELYAELLVPTPKAPSDGSHADYYVLPEGATELNDLIEARGMSFARGNIFKAVYRLGEKQGVDVEYDLNKIILFAQRLKGMNQRGESL
jgi:hypothetical protein